LREAARRSGCRGRDEARRGVHAAEVPISIPYLWFAGRYVGVEDRKEEIPVVRAHPGLVTRIAVRNVLEVSVLADARHARAHEPASGPAPYRRKVWKCYVSCLMVRAGYRSISIASAALSVMVGCGGTTTETGASRHIDVKGDAGAAGSDSGLIRGSTGGSTEIGGGGAGGSTCICTTGECGPGMVLTPVSGRCCPACIPVERDSGLRDAAPNVDRDSGPEDAALSSSDVESPQAVCLPPPQLPPTSPTCTDLPWNPVAHSYTLWIADPSLPWGGRYETLMAGESVTVGGHKYTNNVAGLFGGGAHGIYGDAMFDVDGVANALRFHLEGCATPVGPDVWELDAAVTRSGPACSSCPESIERRYTIRLSGSGSSRFYDFQADPLWPQSCRLGADLCTISIPY